MKALLVLVCALASVSAFSQQDTTGTKNLELLFKQSGNLVIKFGDTEFLDKTVAAVLSEHVLYEALPQPNQYSTSELTHSCWTVQGKTGEFCALVIRKTLRDGAGGNEQIVEESGSIKIFYTVTKGAISGVRAALFPAE